MFLSPTQFIELNPFERAPFLFRGFNLHIEFSSGPIKGKYTSASGQFYFINCNKSSNMDPVMQHESVQVYGNFWYSIDLSYLDRKRIGWQLVFCES